MAPKRREQGEGSSRKRVTQPSLPQGEQLNRNKFCNLEAQKFHDDNLDKREGAERGFIWVREDAVVPMTQRRAMNVLGDMENRVVELGWQEFAKHPSGGSNAIAREFYANLLAANDHGVFVRGVRVPIDSESINALFGLPDTDGFFENVRPSEDEEEIEMLEEQNEFRKPTNGEIVQTLCNSSFTINPYINLNHQLYTSHLNIESKVWYYFLNARLIPTLSGRKLGGPRIMLLYCIMKRIPVNVGKIIRNNIFKTRQTAPFIINFPITITALCERAGVRAETEEKTPPRAPFNLNYVAIELKKVLKVEREARENPVHADDAALPNEPEENFQWDPWMAHQQMMAESGYTQMMLSNIMEAMHLQIPPRPAAHPGFAPPRGRNEEQDEDMDED